MNEDKLKMALAKEPIKREVMSEVLKVISDLHDCRNELCIKCGKYHDKHLGACDGCRWEDL